MPGTASSAGWRARGALEPAIRRALARTAVPPEDLGTATRKVLTALRQAITEERGRWILGFHPEARSECRLRVAGPEGVHGAVIDRLFREAEGTLWIVDFKTSTTGAAWKPAGTRARALRRAAPGTRARSTTGSVRTGAVLFPAPGGEVESLRTCCKCPCPRQPRRHTALVGLFLLARGIPTNWDRYFERRANQNCGVFLR